MNSNSFMWCHTHSYAPLLLLGKHRCDNLARTRLSATYPAWPTWQLQWCVPAAHPRLRIVEVRRLCPSRTPKGKKSQTVRSGDLGGHLENTWSFCPARPNHLFGKCSLRNVQTARCQCSICSPILIKNIPVSFDFITTWNEGVFLCSSCILWVKNKYNLKYKITWVIRLKVMSNKM